MQEKLDRKLSTKLVSLVLLISALVSLIFVGIQALAEYRNQLRSVDRAAQTVFANYSSILAEGLYKLDRVQLETTLKSIQYNPDIASVMVKSENFDLQLSLENKDLTPTRTISWPLIHKMGQDDFIAGTLELAISHDNVVNNLKKKLLSELGILLLRVFIISFIVLLVIERLLVRPIVKLSSTLSEIDPKEFETINIKCFRHSESDELTRLIDTVNERGIALQEAYQEINIELQNRKNIQSRVISLAQQAETAKIASSVLHNTANALMIASMIPRKIERENTKLSRLTKRALNAEENPDDYFFISKDQLLDYNDKIASHLSKLTQSQTIANDLIRSQQNNARIDDTLQEISLQGIMHDILVLQEEFCKKHKVRLSMKKVPEFRTKIVRYQLANIFINIIKNAVESILEAGSDEPCIEISFSEQQNYIEIDICDNGIGVDPDQIPKIYEGSFTSKADGHGFGFSSCVRIISGMQGRMTLHSEGRGKGATVRVRLLRAGCEPPQVSAPLKKAS